MGILSRQEYAAYAGCSTAVVNTNVSRGKLKSLPDKTIDTEDPQNILWLKMRKQKAKTAAAKEELNKAKTQQATEPEVVVVHSKKEPAIDPEQRKKNHDASDRVTKAMEKKTLADARKAELEAELKQLQVDKMMGNLIPVDLMATIFKLNIQNIYATFENELQNIASIYCDILAGGDRDKLAEVIEKMREQLKRIIEETKKNAQQEIDSAINEYSETRSRGERK